MTEGQTNTIISCNVKDIITSHWTSFSVLFKRQASKVWRHRVPNLTYKNLVTIFGKGGKVVVVWRVIVLKNYAVCIFTTGRWPHILGIYKRRSILSFAWVDKKELRNDNTGQSEIYRRM